MCIELHGKFAYGEKIDCWIVWFLVYMTENGNIIFIEVGTHLYTKTDLTKHCKKKKKNNVFGEWSSASPWGVSF
jgi:hypothetical protein